MANPNHFELLRQGVENWNQWRQNNSGVKPDLSRADLRGLHEITPDMQEFRYTFLDSVNFDHADLSGADLSRANLQKAQLRKSDLTGAKLKGSDFTNAYLVNAQLKGANLDSASLAGANCAAADLSFADLTKSTLYYASFYEADLSSAELSNADLSDANLSYANLSGANLNGANLSGVKALNTDFSGATLTGSCIQDWNINYHTKLHNIACDYIFIADGFTDRIPHDPNKFFAPGDFAKLVQQSLNTVSLIFREGLDWRAFAYSFQQVQVQYANEQITIQSIENKGDGTVVVKLAIAPDTDKGSIEQSFFRGYELAQKIIAGQYELVLEAKDKHINQLFALLQQSQEKLGEMPKLIAETSKSDIYTTTVNGNVSNLANKMQDSSSQQADTFLQSESRAASEENDIKH